MMRIFAQRQSLARTLNFDSARKSFAKRFWVVLLSAVLLATGANFVQAPVAMAAVQETSMDRYFDTATYSCANNQGNEGSDGGAFNLAAVSTVQFWSYIPASKATASLMFLNKESSWEIGQNTTGNFMYAYMGPSGWDWIDTGVYLKKDAWQHIAFVN